MSFSRRVLAGSGLAASLMLAASCATNAPRIDGTSDQSFNTTHRQLLDSLSPENSIRFVLAELVYLSRFDCARPQTPIPHQPTLNEVSGGMTSFVACRRELDGKGFADILRLAKQGSVKVGFMTEPPEAQPPTGEEGRGVDGRQ